MIFGETITVEKKIGSISGALRTVRIVIIFKRYTEKQFNQDLDDFRLYQTKQKIGGTNIEYKIYNIKEFQQISYPFLVQNLPKLLSEPIFEALRQRPELILSDELNIQIKVRRIKDWAYSVYSFDRLMTIKDALFQVAGQYLLYSIIAPFFYFRKYDFQGNVKLFLHEMTHYVDAVKQLLSYESGKKREEKYENKFEEAMALNYLYSSLFNLREEGLADFIARAGSKEMDISGKAIKEYNKNLRKLIFLDPRNAREFYERRIGFGNMDPSGEYTIGRYMCLTIVIAIAKEKGVGFTVRKGREEYFGVDLDKFLKEGSTFHVKIESPDSIVKKSGIPATIMNLFLQKIWAKPIEKLKSSESGIHYYFVRFYEQACNYLKISEENRAMTVRRFYKLVKEGREFHKRERKRQLESKGFVAAP